MARASTRMELGHGPSNPPTIGRHLSSSVVAEGSSTITEYPPRPSLIEPSVQIVQDSADAMRDQRSSSGNCLYASLTSAATERGFTGLGGLTWRRYRSGGVVGGGGDGFSSA